MLKNILGLKTLGGKYADIYSRVQEKESCALLGVDFAHKTHLVSGLDKRIVYLTDASDRALLVEQLSAFYKMQNKNQNLAELKFQSLKDFETSVYSLENIEDNLIYKHASSNAYMHNRINVLYRLFTNNYNAVILDIKSFLDCYITPAKLFSNVESLKINNKISLDKLAGDFVDLGYERVTLVDGAGQFSIRGDIVDFFCPLYYNPVRVEFFGDTIESISFFDIFTQRKREKLNEATIITCSEYLDSSQYTILNSMGDFNSKESLLERLQKGDSNASLGIIRNLFGQSTIFDYIDEDTIFVVDSKKLVDAKCDLILNEHKNRYNALVVQGAVPNNAKNLLHSIDTLQTKLQKYQQIQLEKDTNAVSKFEHEYKFNQKPLTSYTGINAGKFAHDVKNWQDAGFGIVICTKTPDYFKGITQNLNAEDIGVTEVNEELTSLQKGEVSLIPFSLPYGLVIPEQKFVVVGSDNILARQNNQAAKGKIVRRNVQDTFISPQVGDYVVHHIHGIGLLEAIEKKKVSGITKDYLKVKYANDDYLFVSVENTNLLSRYSTEEAPAKLSKMGGADFDRLKSKAKKYIKELAFNLVELYAKRDVHKGYKFSVDSQLNTEFDNAFPHTLTPDQFTAVEEIKQDMQSNKVMDRLLCADVGYGKTEVAFRAIFKAILDGKQAAILCPTTILAFQHYRTSLERFNSFGVNIGLLSRFSSTKEINITLQKLKDGKIDLIIGTHRLLSADVVFKDLGLLVLDEEQRFGVSHKEKLKLLKTQIDTLTLSATPIPRTLYMSLIGVRDISVIETPPVGRLPVQTYLLEYNESFVKDAIERELARDGQVFILFNRVEGIESFALSIAKLVNAKIGIAHGQLGETQIEDTITDFYSGKLDILVSTTIIENGIDIKRANTIILANSHMLGLSQIYQLRGRVGRSDRIAYCYLTYPKNRVLTEDATKRLAAVLEHNSLGSGFKIAMKDLEIRGAGNILGAEQSGHIQRIGYDLYFKLLKEELSRLKGEPLNDEIQEVSTIMDIDLDANIPLYYIADEGIKLRLFKRISNIDSIKARQELREELTQIHGKIPIEVDNLILIALLKNLSSKIAAHKISIKGLGTRGQGLAQQGSYKALIELPNIEALKNSKLQSSLETFKQIATLTQTKLPAISFAPNKNIYDLAKTLLEFLLSLN